MRKPLEIGVSGGKVGSLTITNTPYFHTYFPYIPFKEASRRGFFIGLLLLCAWRVGVGGLLRGRVQSILARKEASTQMARYGEQYERVVTIIGIDPGMTTGVASVQLRLREIAGYDVLRACSYEVKIKALVPGEIARFNRACTQQLLRSMAAHEEQFVRVVIEDFTVRPKGLPNHSADTLSPLILRHALTAHWAGKKLLRGSDKVKVHLSYEQASGAKSVITDKRLKSSGCWVVGSDHERDAWRHVLMVMRRMGLNTDQSMSEVEILRRPF